MENRSAPRNQKDKKLQDFTYELHLLCKKFRVSAWTENGDSITLIDLANESNSSYSPGFQVKVVWE